MAGQRARGLTADQLGELRARVDGGGRARVVLSGSQFPPASTGTVVRIGDPSVDGEDYVTVRVRLGGVIDELAFSPAELALPGRKEAGAPAKDAPTRRSAKTPAEAAMPGEAKTSTVSRPARSTASRRAPAPQRVTVTISSDDADWAVSAQRGTRSVLRKTPVPPGVIAAVARLLDKPAVTEAVAAVNDTSREQAEARAEQLRAELAGLEAVLDSHRLP